MPDQKRYFLLDAFRGIAVILMITYHFFFDLNYFSIQKVDLDSFYWIAFRTLIGFLFLFIVGVSFFISKEKNEKSSVSNSKFYKRGTKLAFVALLITVTTWFYPNQGFIKFGIIHLISLSCFAIPFFFSLKQQWNLLIALLIVGFGIYANFLIVDNNYLFWLGLVSPEYSALDHYPLLPWFGVILLGFVLGKNLVNRLQKYSVDISSNSLLNILNVISKIGQNSLLIYLLHQPILITLLLIFSNGKLIF